MAFRDVVRGRLGGAKPVEKASEGSPAEAPHAGEAHRTQGGAPGARLAEASPRPAMPGPDAESAANPLPALEASRKTFRWAVATMEEVFQSVRARASLPIAQVDQTQAALLENLRASEALLVPFFSTGDYSAGPAPEAVNICVLSLSIGMRLGYPPDELRPLGLAALLHDVGRARLPTALLERTAPLTKVEHDALKRGPGEGAQLIRDLGPSYARLAHVVLQVNERADGSGYPMGLKGADIHEHAQVVGLADVYESLVHHRPFRPRLWPPEALKEILQQERTRFPDRILKALIQVLAMLPVGCLVRLNTGEIGRVVSRTSEHPLRPVVAVLVGGGQRLAEPKLVDLSQNPFLHFSELVSEETLDAEGKGLVP